VLYQGATPVFADVSPDTLNLDPDEIIRRIAKRTRALIPVDYAGHPSDLQAILTIAEQHGLVVIEDASHALGAEYRGRRIGSFGHMTTFSFHPVKHVATGEGGMVTTNDAALADRLRLFRNHGIASSARARALTAQWHYEMVELGYNYRLSDIASALGLSQLRTIDANVARRRQIARRYHQTFADCVHVSCPVERQDVISAWHLYPIRLNLASLRVGRAEIFAALRAENIGVNVHYIPVHYHPFYKRRFGGGLGCHPRAETAYDTLLSLPMFHAMLDSDVDDVIAAVLKVTRYYAH
jgi:dTDP-4-amino-4,6-dideoxygalactose transaminase